MRIEARLAELGLVLPPAVVAPSGARLPFSPVRIVGARALVSGHGPQNGDGTPAGPFGKVGAEVTIEEAYAGRAPDGALDPRQPSARAR